MINLNSFISGGNDRVQQVINISKDQKYLQLQGGKVVTVAAFSAAAASGMLAVDPQDQSKFTLKDGARLYQRQDGCYGFTDKAQTSAAKVEF